MSQEGELNATGSSQDWKMTFPVGSSDRNGDALPAQATAERTGSQRRQATIVQQAVDAVFYPTLHPFQRHHGETETTRPSFTLGFAQAAVGGSPLSELIRAVRRGDLASVRRLLQESPACAGDVLESTQETAFSVAFAQGYRSICELLLEHGVRPLGACLSFRNRHITRDSLVRLAVREANLPLVRWLLDCGAPVHTPEIDGTGSALALAAWNGDSEIVDELLQRGAILREEDCVELDLPASMPPSAWSMEGGRADMTSFRLLAIACYHNHVLLTKQLLSTRSDLRDRELMRKCGVLSLYFATYRENEGVAEELIARGAQADGVIGDCVSVASAAVQVDSVRMLRLVQRACVGPLLCDKLLLDAAQYGAISCVRELLLSKATASTLRDEALELSVANNSTDIAIDLFHASPVAVHPAALERCMRDASENGNAELLELLLSHHHTVHTSVLQKCVALACLKGHADIVSLLVAYGVDVNAPSMHGTSFLLHEVVSSVFRHSASFEVATLLLQHGASVDATNTFDETPLEALHHKRFQAKSEEAVSRFNAMQQLLRDYGATCKR